MPKKCDGWTVTTFSLLSVAERTDYATKKKGWMMKLIVFCALAAGVILSTGCSDDKKANEAIPVEIAPKASPADPVKSATKDLTRKAESVTEQAKTTAADITEKAQSAIKNFTASKADVLTELNQPVADLKAKVETLAQPELLAYADTYKDVLLEKKDQLAGLTSKLKGLPMGDVFGEKGKAIKDQISQYTTQFKGLKERYGIYLNKLKSLGVDLSKFGI